MTIYSIERLKREATRLKKAEGIKHTDALDQVAKTVGFDTWAKLMASTNRQTEETA